MPVKKKSTGKKSSKKGTKKRGKKAAGRKGSPKGKTGDKKDEPVDMLNPHAMENLQYIAHGPVDALEIRGFGWTAAPKKKKGKKGKKKK